MGKKKKAKAKPEKKAKAKPEKKAKAKPEEKAITAAEAGDGILANIEDLLNNSQPGNHAALLSIHKGEYRQG